LRPRTLLRLLVIFAVALGFAVAHLHLRFSLNRALIETQRLQELSGTLTNDIDELRVQTGKLTEPARLYEYAKSDLEMVAYNPAQHETIRIPEKISTLYAMARAQDASRAEPASQTAPAGSRGAWMQALSERVGLIGEALARGTERNEESGIRDEQDEQ
jgi:cell division protein FtsL